ncbi:MAG: Ig-like domain-containing protein [Gemmatimonadota bacterium]|nr:Ig-like domain-containing protein [Gemmatimonadota bacterium]MDH5805732.1 Ig-like domain-containing protein [Gemmatimonadota bacterium]
MTARNVGVWFTTGLIAAALTGCGNGTGPNDPVISLQITASADTAVSIGETVTFDVLGLTAGGDTVTTGYAWISDSAQVATISGTGASVNAISVGNGNTTIRVSRDSISAQATLVVQQVAVAVVMSADSTTLIETFTAQLTAAAQDANANDVVGATVVWSADAGAATVNGTGLVTGAGPGTANVIATYGTLADSSWVTVEAISYAAHVQPIFDANCATAGCHVTATQPAGLDLSSGNSYADLVNVNSTQAGGGVRRVKANQSANSYVIHKLEGTQASVGGSGVQMPSGASPLAQETINVIKLWIDRGAVNN